MQSWPRRPVLEVKNLSVNYGAVSALRGVSLHVRPGEVVALLGANGAGKSTTLRAISGLGRPRTGEIRFLGQRIDGLPSSRIVRLGVAHSPEGRRVFGSLTVAENLGWVPPLVRTGAASTTTATASMPSFPASRSEAGQRRRRCRAASSRWWRSAAR